MTDFKDFDGKVVVVTGGASGIGRATAHLFASQSARTVILDRDGDRAAIVVAEIIAVGGRAVAIVTDVADAASCEKAVVQVHELFGRIDVLINSAGIIRRASVVDTNEEDWDRILEVNLKSIFLLSRHVIPLMRQTGGGSIVNLSSGWGIVGGGKAAAYCAAKGGVVLLTKAMAIDHGAEHIRVNCVCPGDTHTPMLYDEACQLGLAENALVLGGDQRPLGRIGQPEEIASAIAYLASSAASFITGATLIVDGGGLAGSP